MPIYNTAPTHLREAIKSVLSQTFKDFEFLIINSSPDNKELDKIVAEFKDPRIIYKKGKKTLEISEAFNILIDMARGSYLAICEHDDISLPMRFEKQVAYLDANPNVGVVSAQIRWFPKKEEKGEWQTRNPTDNFNIKVKLMKDCALQHPVAMIRKSVLMENDIRYEFRFNPAVDHRLWIRLIDFTEFHNIDEVLLKYRWFGGNASVLQRQRLQDAVGEVRIYAQNKYPALYLEYLARYSSRQRVWLFGFIPLFKIIRRPGKILIKLFDRITVIKIK